MIVLTKGEVGAEAERLATVEVTSDFPRVIGTRDEEGTPFEVGGPAILFPPAPAAAETCAKFSERRGAEADDEEVEEVEW
jgi:hypothetical protein